MRLVHELGFDPFDDGGFGDSWRQQPGTPVYNVDRDAAGVRRALTEASPERKPEWRAGVNSQRGENHEPGPRARTRRSTALVHERNRVWHWQRCREPTGRACHAEISAFAIISAIRTEC